jgi:alkylation response protein AidB-like acyl-CoA dehydrogenase
MPSTSPANVERVTSEALQIHGGAGYTTDFAGGAPLARRPLDEDLRGTSEIQLRIVSDGYLPRPAP